MGNVRLSVSRTWPLSAGAWFPRSCQDAPVVLVEPVASGGVQVKRVAQDDRLDRVYTSSSRVEDVIVGDQGIFVSAEDGLRRIDWSGQSVLLSSQGASLIACEGSLLAAVFRGQMPDDPRQLWPDEKLQVLTGGKWQQYAERQSRYAHAIDVYLDKQGSFKVAVASLLSGYPLRSVVEVYGPRGKELEWEGAEGIARGVYLSPQSDGGFVACGKTIARFDRNGRTSWRYDSPGSVLGLLVEEDGAVVAGINNAPNRPPALSWLRKDQVVRIGPDGSRSWSVGFGAEVRSLSRGPLVEGKTTTVVCTADGVAVVDANGKVRASLALNSGARTARSLGNRVYVISGDWVLYEIELQEQQGTKP